MGGMSGMDVSIYSIRSCAVSDTNTLPVYVWVGGRRGEEGGGGVHRVLCNVNNKHDKD